VPFQALLGEHGRVVGRSARAIDHAELVAAQPAHDPTGRHERGQDPRDVAEHLVAHLRREDVVDVLETVEIHDQYGEPRTSGR
jgi:hypothetical protein